MPLPPTVARVRAMETWEPQPPPPVTNFNVNVRIERLPNEDGLKPHVQREIQARVNYALGSLLDEVIRPEHAADPPQGQHEIAVSVYWDEDTWEYPSHHAIRPGYSEWGKHIVVSGYWNGDGCGGFAITRDPTTGRLGWDS